MQTHGGSSLQRVHLWVRKLVVESASFEQSQRANKDDENNIAFQKGRMKKRGWDTARGRQDWQGSHGRHTNYITCLESTETVCGDQWSGWAQHQTNAVIGAFAASHQMEAQTEVAKAWSRIGQVSI